MATIRHAARPHPRLHLGWDDDYLLRNPATTHLSTFSSLNRKRSGSRPYDPRPLLVSIARVYPTAADAARLEAEERAQTYRGLRDRALSSSGEEDGPIAPALRDALDGLSGGVRRP